jgi:4-amino-4-deoxy-L-arabinose transferase-like glycosyltransferase
MRVSGRWRTEILVGLGLLALTTLLRSPGFLRSVIDWDESLYFLMAEAWWHGHLPYLVLWDNKPVGIYVLFLGAIALFGDGVAAIRIAGILAVATTGILLYRLAAALPETSGRRWPGLLAASAYILGATANGGLASNTELFLAPFTALALILALADRISRARAFAIGGLLGLACMVKYVAVFESVPIYLVMLAGLRPHPQGFWRRALQLKPVFVLGAVIPFLAAFTPYVVTGEIQAFVTASLASNLHRVALPFSADLLSDAVTIEFRDWAPLCLMPAVLLIDLLRLVVTRRTGRTSRVFRVEILLLGWFVAAAIGVAAAKSFYQHYFLQLLPVLSTSLAWVLAERLPSGRGRGLLGLLALAWLASTAGGAISETLAPVDWQQPGLLKDQPAAIARDLRPDLAAAPGAVLYVFDYEPILYSLTGAPPPTRYAFPSFMISRFLSSIAGVDPLREFAAIMARHPLFIVRSRLRHPTPERDEMALYAALDRTLASDYVLWRLYPDAAIYRRRTS